MKKMICLLLVLCCVISLGACGASSNTPFSNLADQPDYDTVIKRYGQNYEAESGNSHLRYKYKWMGNEGYLDIFCEEERVKDSNNNDIISNVVKRATWIGITHSEEESSNLESKIIDYLNKSIGNYSSQTKCWTDTKGNKYYEGTERTNDYVVFVNFIP